MRSLAEWVFELKRRKEFIGSHDGGGTLFYYGDLENLIHILEELSCERLRRIDKTVEWTGEGDEEL